MIDTILLGRLAVLSAGLMRVLVAMGGGGSSAIAGRDAIMKRTRGICNADLADGTDFR